uniref:SCAN box domain-containing protein n=1 Tax=Laticauda laticaudata TaxID=8630 RepID=A0A8C5RLI7_LATLA
VATVWIPGAGSGSSGWVQLLPGDPLKSTMEERDLRDPPPKKDSPQRREEQRQHFRRFRYQEAEGPRGAYSRLQEHCRRWLKADMSTKEQIVELLILEQFLAILPPEMQRWVRACGPDNCSQAVVLVEDFLGKKEELKHRGPLRR